MIKYLKSLTMAFTLISFLISLVLAGIIIAAAGYSPVEEMCIRDSLLSIADIRLLCIVY